MCVFEPPFGRREASATRFWRVKQALRRANLRTLSALPFAPPTLFGTSPVGVGATGTGTADRVTMSPVCLSGPADETRRDSESN